MQPPIPLPAAPTPDYILKLALAGLEIQSSPWNFSVAASQQQILGPNPKRIGLTLAAGSNPLSVSSAGTTAATVMVKNVVVTGGTQVLATYTCPANTQAFVQSVICQVVSGAQPTCVSWWTRGANTVQVTGSLSFGAPVTIGLWLQPLDVFFIQYSSGTTGGHLDFGMSIAQYSGGGAVATIPYLNVGFQNGITAGNAFPLYPGNRPITLDYGIVGAPIQGNVYAISSTGSIQLSVIETFIAEMYSRSQAIMAAEDILGIG